MAQMNADKGPYQPGESPSAPIRDIGGSRDLLYEALTCEIIGAAMRAINQSRKTGP